VIFHALVREKKTVLYSEKKKNWRLRRKKFFTDQSGGKLSFEGFAFFMGRLSGKPDPPDSPITENVGCIHQSYPCSALFCGSAKISQINILQLFAEKSEEI